MTGLLDHGGPAAGTHGSVPPTRRTGDVPIGSYGGGWFARDEGLTLTTHNGAAPTRHEENTLPAFVRAHEAGYRRFQLDVLAIADDLVSWHSLFGRHRRVERMDRARLREVHPDIPTVRELLTHPRLTDSSWNIELKSRRGLDQLLTLLHELAAEGWDLSTILVSSPFRPSVLEAIAKELPQVALAAPVVHGGVFGVRMLGADKARPAPHRRYDCQQVYHRLVRRERSREDEDRLDPPPRQAWNLRSRRALNRVLDAGAHAIVDARRLHLRDAAKVAVRGHRLPTHEKIEVLALGGGGWRGAFGAVGTVMYLDVAGRWADVREVVGISGGSFAVAALAEDREEVTHRETVDNRAGDAPIGPDGRPGHDPGEPAATLRRLIDRLEGAGRRMAGATALVALVLAAGGLLVLGGFVAAVHLHPMWGPLLMVPPVLLTSLVVRALVSWRWHTVLRKVYGRAVMRDDPPEGSAAGRRYALGATGLHDGRLYSFTTTAEHEREGWLGDRTRPVPLARRELAWAVARSTSLPGLGQLGVRKVVLPSCDHDPAPHHGGCERVPDRLVDGGVSGIFGRGLLGVRSRDTADEPVGEADPANVLVMDAGRSLAANGGTTMRHRAAQAAERLSAIALLARWLMVAFDISYRGELRGVRDGNVIDGYRYWLVRLAEDEVISPYDPAGDEDALGAADPTGGPNGEGSRTVGSGGEPSPARGRDLQRLFALREQVHRFSLLTVSRLNADRTMAAAVAACALELEDEPDIEGLLDEIDRRLGRDRGLLRAWTDVPLL
ncbi:MAG: hypothetical protein S0880_36520 [Actinomycetota bacterium]|nr:hypothetical protein [Actinomycetota bacterium]